MAEPWSVFEVQSSNGISVLNGQKIDTDGTYIFKVQDLYGNELIRTLIVDKLPPEPLITTIDGEMPRNRFGNYFRVILGSDFDNRQYAVDFERILSKQISVRRNV